MIDFDSIVEIKNTTTKRKSNNSGGRLATAIIINNSWYAELKIENNIKNIPILIEFDSINKIEYIYSSLKNDYYPIWTPKYSPGKSSRLDISNNFWSILKPNIKIKGSIKDNIFILNYEYLNNINKKIFEKYLKHK